MHRAMRERRCGARAAQRLQRRVMGDPAERHDRAQVRHGLRSSRSRNCRQVLISAGTGLFCGGTQRTALAIRQSTSLQPVVGPRLIDALGKADIRAGRVEQVAGIVAGERPPGAVGALHARRQARRSAAAPSASPNDGTGALNQSGSRARACVAKADQPRAERAIAVGFGVGEGCAGRRGSARRSCLSPRNRRHRPAAPWWSRAAGIAARDGAARAGRDARTGRGRSWIAARPGR